LSANKASYNILIKEDAFYTNRCSSKKKRTFSTNSFKGNWLFRTQYTMPELLESETYLWSLLRGCMEYDYYYTFYIKHEENLLFESKIYPGRFYIYLFYEDICTLVYSSASLI